MKISRILPVVGFLTLLPCGAAFSQSPNQIPPGAGVGVERQPPGSRFREPTNRSLSCSQEANAKGLQGKAREVFLSQCK
jgi:hypothetical protein